MSAWPHQPVEVVMGEIRVTTEGRPRKPMRDGSRPVDLCIYSELMLLKLSGSCEHGVSVCLRTVATNGSIVYSLGDM